jgi:succinate dehydrogenase/fumarate reductase cytochrome b subunit
MLVSLLAVGALTTLLAQVDIRITAAGFAKPYYAVHVLHNAAIVALTASDVWGTLTDLHGALCAPITWPAVWCVYALHLYHVLLYWRSFHRDDWLHHMLMIGVALPLGSVVPAGRLMGFSLFFTTGLPGGINYALLFAERNGWVSRATEKAWNVPIHQWLRSPGCVAHGALTLAAGLSAPEASSFERAATVLVALLNVWNGVYFANQVLRADALRKAEVARADGSNTGPTGGPNAAAALQ